MAALAAKAQQRAASQPTNIGIQHSAARFALQAGDEKGALQLAERTVKLAEASGDQRAVRRTLLTLSMARAANKDYQGACDAAQEVLRDEPGNATAVEMRLFNCNRPDQAPSLEKSDAYRWLAQQSPEVPHTPEEWLKRQKERPMASFAGVSASMKALKVGDAAAALRRAEEAVAADGSDPMAWAQRGLARDRLGDFNGAIIDLSRALAMGMVWNVLYQLRAKALIKAKRYQAAVGDATVALSLDPRDASSYAARATAKLGAGMAAQDVLADFEAAAKLDPATYQSAFRQAQADLAGRAPGGGAAATTAGEPDAGLTEEQRQALGKAVPAGLDGAAAGRAGAWPWAAAAGAAGLVLLLGLAALKRRRSGPGFSSN